MAETRTEKKFQLRVITPTETKIDEQTSLVIMRCIDGAWGVLAGHDERSAVLDIGAVRIITDGVERRLAAYGGLAEVKDNVLTILTQEAHWPEDINHDRARAERENVARQMLEETTDVEVRRLEVMLRRALVQIEVSSYPVINK
ncbi:MAG: F0F1 ATP synthase subunit epsilon [Defluviitaleaceae bacterium]|nr:F0F1 ATP synthase subunit epsilon [Defluviitaleaceae bacterium]